MIWYHFAFIGDFLYGQRLFEMYESFFELIGHIARVGFITVSGISLYFFSRKYQGFRPYMKRFLKLLTCALIITCLSFIFLPEFLIFNGILHFFAFATLLNFAFISIPYKKLCFVLCLLTSFLIAQVESSNLFLHVLGFAGMQRSSLDFFPLIPWYNYIMAGFFLAPTFIKLSTAFVLPQIEIMRKLGSRSLEFYMLHPFFIWLYYMF